MALILFLNGVVAFRFAADMMRPPLRVERAIVELGRLEEDPRFASFNVRVEDFWARLWANAFLLKKPQYFVTHTYEGRLNTELKGEWDLSDSFLPMVPLDVRDFVQFNARFHLVRAKAAGRIHVEFADGWYAEEKSAVHTWRWSDGRGRIVLTNRGAHPIRVNLQMEVRSFEPGELTLRLDQREAGRTSLDGSVEIVDFNHLTIPAGRTVLTLECPPPVVQKNSSPDTRRLALALYRFKMEATAQEK